MSEWYCAINNVKYGPCNDQQIEQWIKEGRISGNTLVWTDGMPKWLPLEKVERLAGLVSSGEANLTPDQEAYLNALYPIPKENPPYAVASLVLGISSIVVYPLGLILGIVALVLKAKARKEVAKAPNKYKIGGLETAGMAMGIVGIVLGSLVLIVIILFVAVIAAGTF